MPGRDYFPVDPTARTFIAELVELGLMGQREVNEYVVSEFTAGLRAYYYGSSWSRTLGPFDELIGEFFLRKLSKENFYGQWLENGMRLRRWLLNSFRFFLREEARARRKERTSGGEVIEDTPDDGPSPEELMARGVARAVVERAFAEARAQAEEADQAEHWRAFELRRLEGLGFSDIAERLDGGPRATREALTAERVKTMERTARDRFHATLRQMLIDHGSSPRTVDRDLRDLLDDLDA